jgi:hypothetical protein
MKDMKAKQVLSRVDTSARGKDIKKKGVGKKKQTDSPKKKKERKGVGGGICEYSVLVY